MCCPCSSKPVDHFRLENWWICLYLKEIRLIYHLYIFCLCPWGWEASDSLWESCSVLRILCWQNQRLHAKHLGRWRPASLLSQGQISRVSLMCRQGLPWSSALALNNLLLQSHRNIHNLYRPPLANGRCCNNSDRSGSSTEERGRKENKSTRGWGEMSSGEVMNCGIIIKTMQF